MSAINPAVIPYALAPAELDCDLVRPRHVLRRREAVVVSYAG